MIATSISSMRSSCRGYVALTAALALALTLTALAISASLSSLMTRLAAIAAEDSWVAAHRARSCVAVALLYHAQNPAYELPSGGETIRIAPDAACGIVEADVEGSTLRIRARAQVGESVHVVEATVLLVPGGLPETVRWKRL